MTTALPWSTHSPLSFGEVSILNSSRVPDAHELLSETYHTLTGQKIKLLICPKKITLTMDFPISVNGASIFQLIKLNLQIIQLLPLFLSTLKLGKFRRPSLKHQSRIQLLLPPPRPKSWSSYHHTHPDYHSSLLSGLSTTSTPILFSILQPQGF